MSSSYRVPILWSWRVRCTLAWRASDDEELCQQLLKHISLLSSASPTRMNISNPFLILLQQVRQDDTVPYYSADELPNIKYFWKADFLCDHRNSHGYLKTLTKKKKEGQDTLLIAVSASSSDLSSIDPELDSPVGAIQDEETVDMTQACPPATDAFKHIKASQTSTTPQTDLILSRNLCAIDWCKEHKGGLSNYKRQAAMVKEMWKKV
ncbi:hypothetical protein EDC04DRAFT_2611651 [Pisolithus marmoratus]|nr:hypothetical protein EDC04DRAFT_2611651 [Pisolithus marmoratus]